MSVTEAILADLREIARKRRDLDREERGLLKAHEVVTGSKPPGFEEGAERKPQSRTYNVPKGRRTAIARELEPKMRDLLETAKAPLTAEEMADELGEPHAANVRRRLRGFVRRGEAVTVAPAPGSRGRRYARAGGPRFDGLKPGSVAEKAAVYMEKHGEAFLMDVRRDLDVSSGQLSTAVQTLEARGLVRRTGELRRGSGPPSPQIVWLGVDGSEERAKAFRRGPTERPAARPAAKPATRRRRPGGGPPKSEKVREYLEGRGQALQNEIGRDLGEKSSELVRILRKGQEEGWARRDPTPVPTGGPQSTIRWFAVNSAEPKGAPQNGADLEGADAGQVARAMDAAERIVRDHRTMPVMALAREMGLALPLAEAVVKRLEEGRGTVVLTRGPLGQQVTYSGGVPAS